MRKKQILATMVMLSLLQGSVYAADKITEADFDEDTNSLTLASNDVGPIYIIDNKEKDYIINAPEGGLNITGVEHRGIIVSTENSNDNASMSTLTINGNVTIGYNQGEQIVLEKELLGDDSYKRTSTALVQVGQQGYNGNGGKLVINGDLNIENIDYSGVSALISVGSADDEGTSSSMQAGNITINNVVGDTLVNLSGDSRADDKVQFKVGDLTVMNSTIKTLIAVNQYTAPLEVDNIIAKNVNFTGSAISASEFFTKGNITIEGTDSENKSTFGQYLLDFQNGGEQQVTIDGGINLKNLKGTYDGWNFTSAFFKNGNGGGNLSVDYINVDNLEMVYAGRSDASAVRIDNGSYFEVKDIYVNNVLFSGAGEVNREYGIYIASSETDKKINSLTATNITSNATSANDGMAGIWLQNTELNSGVGSVVASNISADNLLTYGIFVSEQDLKANSVDVRKVASKKEIAYGMKLTSGYDSTETGSDIENAYIEDVSSENGMAVGGAVTKGSKDQNANINTFEVNNVKSTNNWSLGIWTNKSHLISAYLSAEDVKSINSDAYGLYSQESCNIEADNAYIANVSSENGVALGLYINGGSEAKFKNLQVEQVNSVNKFAAAVNVRNSILNTDNAYINLPDNEDNYGDYSGFYNGVATDKATKINNIALRSITGSNVDWCNSEGNYLVYGTIVAGAGSKGANGGKITINGKNTQIFGDVFAGNGGEINITLNSGNTLEGQVDDYHELENLKKDEVFRNSAFMDSNGNELEVSSAGKATLNINNGGEWIARGQSFVDTVTLNGGIIDMSRNENSSVTVKNLNGKGGKFKMRLDTGDHANSDMLYVTGSFEGTYELDIIGNEFVPSEITEDNPLRFATVKGDVNTENMNARVTDAGFFNNTYKIIKEQFDKNHSENEDYNGKNNGQESYKPGNDAVLSMFDNGDTNLLITNEGKQSTVSDAGKTIINMSRANYNNAIYMDRLNKRMGEARYINPEEGQGMWVRLRHDRIGKDDAFRSQNTMYELGYDVKQDCDNGEHRTGFAIDYMDGKTEYNGIAGDGDIKRYGLWLYDTWLGDKGHYTDFVAKWGHLENDFDIMAKSTGEKITGDYSNNVFSVSAEYGKKNDMGSGWYIEPQAQLQLARVTGADYTTSQGTKVSLDGINSLIGRAGFRLGRDLNENSTVYVKADLLHEFLGDQTISAYDITTNGVYRETFENKGTWYDVGFGFATALGKNSYAFMDFEKSFGNNNDETYQINAGVQWTF